jgi:hypothetical protein
VAATSNLPRGLFVVVYVIDKRSVFNINLLIVIVIIIDTDFGTALQAHCCGSTLQATPLFERYWDGPPLRALTL